MHVQTDCPQFTQQLLLGKANAEPQHASGQLFECCRSLFRWPVRQIITLLFFNTVMKSVHELL